MVGIKRDLELLRGPLTCYFCDGNNNDDLVHLLRTVVWGIIFTWRPLGPCLKKYIQPEKNFTEDIKSAHVLFSILLNILQDATEVPTVYLLISELDKCGSQQDIDTLQKFIHSTASDQSLNLKWIISSGSGTSLSPENMRWTAEVVLKDLNVASLFNVDRATEQDGIRLYRVQGIPSSTTKEQAISLFQNLTPSEGIYALNTDIWMVPTCDNNQDSLTALMTTKAAPRFLDKLEHTPKEFLHLENLEACLIFDRHFRGFTQLYKNPPTKHINADIIVLPGLDMHPYLCWSNEEISDQVWLRNFLEYDLPTCRVLTYGYNSNFSVKGLDAMQDHCTEFLGELQKVRRTTEEVCRPLILIGQGYGAIIAVQVLIAAKKCENGLNPALRELYKSIRGLIFFATPNRSMLIETIQSLSTAQNVDPTPSFVKVIEDAMQRLTESVLEFNKLVHDLKVMNFVPTHPFDGSVCNRLWIASGKFTEPNRAILNLSGFPETTIQVSSRQISLGKFTITEEPIYGHVIQFLHDLERAAEEERSPEWISATIIKPSGFTEVYAAENAIADIILIPGLAADPWEVWSTSSRSLSHPATLGKFWPASFLPKEWEKSHSKGQRTVSEWPPARVLVWGFGGGPAESDPAVHISMLLQAATQLLDDLMNTRTQGRSIIFVAHSLGGILLKEVLRLADKRQAPKAKDILRCTSAVLFLGTPHRGDGNTQSLIDIVSHAATAHLAVPVEPARISAGTKAELEACQESFVTQWKAHSFEVKCFTETPARNFSTALQQARYSVPKLAATLESRDIKVETIPATSIGFCRFQATHEPGYSQIRMAIGEYLRQIKHDKHLREACLKSLHFDQLQSRELDIASVLDSTGTWLFEHEDFKDWVDWDLAKSPKRRGLLWIRGKPGSGKSTLMKEALRRAKNLDSSFSVSVAGFFFTSRSNVQLQRSPMGLFMTLLYELIQQDKALLLAFIAAYKRKAAETPGIWVWHQEELRDFFKSAYLGKLPGIRNAMVFIDALDESGKNTNKTPYEVAYDLVHFFREVAGGNKLKVCLSSRHYPDIEFSDCPQITTENFNGGDIVHFIADRLFNVKGDAQAKELAGKIAVKAAGVFLWVILVVGSLNMNLGNLDIGKDIEKTLRDVPGELEKLFKNLFGKGSSETTYEAVPETTIAIFQWVLLAKRPLTKNELRHALMIDHQKIEALDETQKWDSSQDCMPKDPEKFLTSLRFYTRGLAEVILHRGEMVITCSAVQLIHESVREFFLKGEGFAILEGHDKPLSLASRHGILAEYCMACILNHGQPIGEFSSLEYEDHLCISFYSTSNPFLKYATEALFYHVSHAELEGRVSERVLRALVDGEQRLWKTWVSLNWHLQHLFSRHRRENYMDPGFAPLHHLCLKQMFSSASYILQLGVSIDTQDMAGYSALHYATERAQVDVIHFLVKNRAKLRIRNRKGQTPLHLALQCHTSDDILNELLEHFSAEERCDGLEDADLRGWRPLHYAVQASNQAAVEVLLSKGALVDSCTNDGFTPLHLAVQASNQAVVEALLSKGASVDSCTNDGATSLHLAVMAKNQATVEVLLSKGALVNSRTNDGATSLYLAVVNRSKMTVDMLLRQGADPNILDKNGIGPLHIAAKKPNAAILHSLMNKGVNINIPNQASEVPIHIRIKEILVIEFLIDAGANTNMRTLINTRNILHFLFWGSHCTESIVAVINAGVDVNATDCFMKTALHYAAEKGLYIYMEQLLKYAGQDIMLSLRDRYGRTPLHYAAQLAEMNIFRLLVDAGADLTAEDNGGKTPVECAGDKIIRNPDLFRFFSQRGYKSTLYTINGQNSRVLSLR